MGRAIGLGLFLVGCSSASVLGWPDAQKGAGGAGSAEADAGVTVTTGTSGGGPASSASSSKAASSSSASSSASSSSSSGTGGAPPECSAPSQCPGADTVCEVRTCDAGKCGLTFTAAGMPEGAQVAADCKENQCDGKGSAISVYQPADVKDDGNTCTTDACTMQGPTNTPWGNEKCHGVCILPPGLVATDNLGNPIGTYPAGPYAACGVEDNVLAPGPLPGKWTFTGVTWKEKIGLTTYQRACGGTALQQAGYTLSPGSTCAKGVQCFVQFYSFDAGVKSYGEQVGTCE